MIRMALINNLFKERLRPNTILGSLEKLRLRRNYYAPLDSNSPTRVSASGPKGEGLLFFGALSIASTGSGSSMESLGSEAIRNPGVGVASRPVE